MKGEKAKFSDTTINGEATKLAVMEMFLTLEKADFHQSQAKFRAWKSTQTYRKSESTLLIWRSPFHASAECAPPFPRRCLVFIRKLELVSFISVHERGEI